MQLIAEDKKQRLQVWAQFDEGAEVYELFASEEASDYIGCADTIPEAKKVAQEWFDEQRSN